MSNYKLPLKQYKSKIRTLNTQNVVIGGESSLPFMKIDASSENKPLIGVEILMNLPKNYSSVLKKAWGECINNPVEWAKQAVNSKTAQADFLAIKFNVSDENDLDSEISKACEILEQIQQLIEVPLLISGANKREIDAQLLLALAKIANRPCIIGMVDENIYKTVIPALKPFQHSVIARTPIDISLAKELNILITELGFSPDKILIDPNMGGLGYGLDYGYSVIERIKQAGLDGDDMLNMPIAVFVGEEAWKAKETKSEAFPEEWGNLGTRAVLWEIMTASSVLAAGTNLLIMWHPDAIKNVRDFIYK